MINRNVTMVQAKMTLLSEYADARVSVIAANAAAKADAIRAEADSRGEQLREEAHAEANQYVKETLGFNTSQMMKYMWARSLKSKGNPDLGLVVGFDGAGVLKTAVGD